MSTSYLIAIDGSDPSLKAVDYVIQETADRGTPAQIYLVNVQPPLPNDVTRFIDNKGKTDSGQLGLHGPPAGG